VVERLQTETDGPWYMIHHPPLYQRDVQEPLPARERLCQSKRRHRRQTGRLPPGSVAVELPRGVLENAGGCGGCDKAQGSGLWARVPL
jgi:hypothetical protein